METDKSFDTELVIGARLYLHTTRSDSDFSRKADERTPLQRIARRAVWDAFHAAEKAHCKTASLEKELVAAKSACADALADLEAAMQLANPVSKDSANGP